MTQQNVILASTSIYRKELFSKLGIPFQCQKPCVDEDELKNQFLQKNMSALKYAEALSKEKARSIPRQKNQIVIGGDQIGVLQKKILEKPLTKLNAHKQLTLMSGKTHHLITAVTVITPKKEHHLNHITKLKMKNLSAQEINRYIEIDLPLDCAGSYKIEKSGIVLFDKIDTDDMTAIQGLPLLWISRLLRKEGYEFFIGK